MPIASLCSACFCAVRCGCFLYGAFCQDALKLDIVYNITSLSISSFHTHVMVGCNENKNQPCAYIKSMFYYTNQVAITFKAQQ